MQNPLSERCFKTICHDVSNTAYLNVLKSLFVEREYPEKEIDHLFENMTSKIIHAQEDIIPILREYTTILILKRFGNSPSQDFKNQGMRFHDLLKSHPQAFDNSLVLSYIQLISVLLGSGSELSNIYCMPSGFILNGIKDIDQRGDQILMNDQIEIAINLLLIALINQDNQAAELAGKVIAALASCIDENGELVVGVWSDSLLKEKGAHFARVYLTLYTLNQISKHPGLENALLMQGDVISRFSDQEILSMGYQSIGLTFFIDLMLNQNLHELNHSIQFDNQSVTLFKDVGLVVSKLGNYSTYLTLSGINHSVGSILSKDVKVLAMGPHYFPLGDLSKFGIYHLIDKEQIIPLTVEKQENSTCLKGMTKLIHSESANLESKPSDTWIELEIFNTLEKLKLTVTLLGEPTPKPVSFAFFVKSKETEMIGNQLVKPKTLDKYIGPSQKVVFKGSTKNLSVIPQFEEKMHLIPLQGKNHFWGADYLLACEMTQFQKKYTWEFQ